MFESPLLEETYITQKGWPKDHPFCREEVTRTPDPYVPNVVRYQLRYFSLTFSSLRLFCQDKIFSITRLFAGANFLVLTKAGAKVLLFFELTK